MVLLEGHFKLIEANFNVFETCVGSMPQGSSSGNEPHGDVSDHKHVLCTCSRDTCVKFHTNIQTPDDCTWSHAHMGKLTSDQRRMNSTSMRTKIQTFLRLNNLASSSASTHIPYQTVPGRSIPYRAVPDRADVMRIHGRESGLRPRE